jgi:hypothetical protein
MLLQGGFGPIKKLLLSRLGQIEAGEEVEGMVGEAEANALGDDDDQKMIFQKFKLHDSMVTLVYNPKVAHAVLELPVVIVGCARFSHCFVVRASRTTWSAWSSFPLRRRT